MEWAEDRVMYVLLEGERPTLVGCPQRGRRRRHHHGCRPQPRPRLDPRVRFSSSPFPPFSIFAPTTFLPWIFPTKNSLTSLDSPLSRQHAQQQQQPSFSSWDACRWTNLSKKTNQLVPFPHVRTVVHRRREPTSRCLSSITYLPTVVSS